MKSLRPHLSWLALLALSVLLLVGGAPLLDAARTTLARDLAALRAQKTALEHNVRQLEDDIATARTLSRAMNDAAVGHYLAPVDRLKIAAQLERAAARTRIDPFTYTLGAEERTTLTENGEAQELAKSLITLAGDAPLDEDVFAFLQKSLPLLPGRTRILELSVSRIGAADAAPTALNAHFSATVEWLSNGSLHTAAGAAP